MGFHSKHNPRTQGNSYRTAALYMFLITSYLTKNLRFLLPEPFHKSIEVLGNLSQTTGRNLFHHQLRAAIAIAQGWCTARAKVTSTLCCTELITSAWALRKGLEFLSLAIDILGPVIPIPEVFFGKFPGFVWGGGPNIETSVGGCLDV